MRLLQIIVLSVLGAMPLHAKAALCPLRGSVDSVIVDTAKVDAFGSYGNFPSLPLQAGEYILTFDDGPTWIETPQILQILKRKCIPATFFMVGFRAETASQIAKLVRDEGFEIGSHSYSHRKLTALLLNEAKDDVRGGVVAVEEAIGGLPHGAGRLFRFPHNAYSPELLAYVRGLSASVSFADLSPEDWRGSSPEESLGRFRKRIANVDRGTILLHDNQPNTVPLLSMIIDEVQGRGGRFVRMVAKGRAQELEVQ